MHFFRRRIALFSTTKTKKRPLRNAGWLGRRRRVVGAELADLARARRASQRLNDQKSAYPDIDAGERQGVDLLSFLFSLIFVCFQLIAF